MTRLTIFVHFDFENVIDDYVLYYLQRVKSLPSEIIFVSTSQLPPNEKEKISSLCKKIICRDNIGYDFYSYKVGLFDAGIDYREYDQVVLCNDSVYGPLCELDTVFQVMNKKNVDLWGITRSKEIEPHLQSYFLVFNKKVIQSKEFSNFFSSIETTYTKKELIKKYEVGLSVHFKTEGFRLSQYIKDANIFVRICSLLQYCLEKRYPRNSKNNPFSFCITIKLGLDTFIQSIKPILIKNKTNPTHFYWRYLLKAGSPFVKIDLFRTNPNDISSFEERLFKGLSSKNFPPELIAKNLNRTKKYYLSRAQRMVDHER